MRTRILIFTTIILFGCFSESEKWEMQHDEEFEVGNLDDALVFINKAISFDSLNNRIFFKRGLVYKEQKKIQAAIADFEKATLLNPNDFYSYNNLGAIYSQKEQYSEASKYYNKALSIKENSDTFIRQGENYLRMKDTLTAKIKFERAILLDSMATTAYLNMGLIAYDQSKYSESIQLFSDALNSFKSDQNDYSFKDLKSLILTYRGLAKLNNGNRTGACDDWTSKINEENDQAKTFISKYCQ